MWEGIVRDPDIRRYRFQAELRSRRKRWKTNFVRYTHDRYDDRAVLSLNINSHTLENGDVKSVLVVVDREPTFCRTDTRTQKTYTYYNIWKGVIET